MASNCGDPRCESPEIEAASFPTPAPRTSSAPAPLEACAGPPGFVLYPPDCDNTRPAISPRGTEECNNLDDDCHGEVDQFTRACGNDCGMGEETCTAGIFEGCTAPLPTRVPPSTKWRIASDILSLECVIVEGNLVLADDVAISLSDDLIVRGGGKVLLGARASIAARNDVTFSGSAALEGTEATIDASSIEINAGVRWSFEGASGRGYSGGGGGENSPRQPLYFYAFSAKIPQVCGVLITTEVLNYPDGSGRSSP